MLALDVIVDADERLKSIVDILDPHSAPMLQLGERTIHLIFWCTGAPNEIVRFQVEIDHPGGIERSPECDLPIASSDSATTASLQLSVPLSRPGRYEISLIFGHERVWSMFFTSADIAPESQTIQ